MGEVRLRYFGFSTHSECRFDSECLRQGVTDWIPAESAEIGTVKQFGAPSRSRINEACGKYMDNFGGDQGDMAWIRKFKEYEFASVYQTVKRTLKEMESNRVWKECRRQLRRSRLHQEWAQKRKMEIDTMKRVMTADRAWEEGLESRHKKKWKKGKRGNYRKRNERKMRESQQKQRTKRGNIVGYPNMQRVIR